MRSESLLRASLAAALGAALTVGLVGCGGSSGGGFAGNVTTVSGSVSGVGSAPLQAAGTGSQAHGLNINPGAPLTVVLTTSGGQSLAALVNSINGRFSIPISGSLAGQNLLVQVLQNNIAIFETILAGAGGGSQIDVGAISATSTAIAQTIRAMARAQAIAQANFLAQMQNIPAPGGGGGPLNVPLLFNALANNAGPFAALIQAYVNTIIQGTFGCSLAQLSGGNCNVANLLQAQQNLINQVQNNIAQFSPPGGGGGGAPPGGFTLVTVNTQGAGEGQGFAYPKAADMGLFAAFAQRDGTLVAGDTNGFNDVFLRDLVGGTFTRVTETPNGDPQNGDSFIADISGDGNIVVFDSEATNLVTPPTTQGRKHIYAFDRTTGMISIMTRPGGVEANGDSYECRVSRDGQYVVYNSNATNLVTGDTNGSQDVFRSKISDGSVIRVSVKDGLIGEQATFTTQFGTSSPTPSADGNLVSFQAQTTDLVPGISGGNIFVRDVMNGTTQLVSTDLAGNPIPNAQNFRNRISSDGLYVVYQSRDDLFANDSDGQDDILVRTLADNTIRQASLDSNGNNVDGFAADPSISADGRFVSFTGQNAGYDPAITQNGNQVYIRDMMNDQTRVASRNGNASGGDSSTITHDGSFVVFGSSGSFVANDGGTQFGHFDVYLAPNPFLAP